MKAGDNIKLRHPATCGKVLHSQCKQHKLHSRPGLNERAPCAWHARCHGTVKHTVRVKRTDMGYILYQLELDI